MIEQIHSMQHIAFNYFGDGADCFTSFKILQNLGERNMEEISVVILFFCGRLAVALLSLTCKINSNWLG